MGNELISFEQKRRYELIHELSLCKNLQTFKIIDWNADLTYEEIEKLFNKLPIVGNIEIMEFLYSRNSDINMSFALLQSCKNNNIKVATWILSNDIDIDKCFDLICCEESVETLKSLLKAIDNSHNHIAINTVIKCFIDGCILGNENIVKFLFQKFICLSRDADINSCFYSILGEWDNIDINSLFYSILRKNHIELALWFKNSFNIDHEIVKYYFQALADDGYLDIALNNAEKSGINLE